MNNNIITAVFGALRETKVRPRYRYDQGQILIVKGVPNLPDFFEAHFANEGDSADATPLIGTPDGVTIPDSYFQSGKTVLAYIYVHDEATDGTTVYKVTIPIINRARPANIDPDPEQADIIAQAIVALNENVGKSEAAADAAEAAQQGAEDAAESVESSAAQISENTQNIADLQNTTTENERIALLHMDEINDTVQSITFDSAGDVSTITHVRNGTAIRTDAFTFGTGSITEVRTLSTGESLTIVTNTTTLQTTVTYAAA